MNSVFDEKKDCCGCRNCEKICPVQAITMKPDEYGFLYPIIDENKCINCKKCKSVCPMIHVTSYPVELSFAARLTEEAIENSASGGAFYALGKSVLDAGGTVFGCVFDRELRAEHIEVNCISDLKRLQGSKYVQSSLKIQNRILELLKEGKFVLFSGTPCQVAAIKSIGKKYHNNLYTVELVCHGVPNAEMWKDYISFLENKFRGRVCDFRFRKKDSKSAFCASMTVEKKGKKNEIRLPSVISSYYYNFLKGKNYRTSCYYCPFAQPNRQSDITICDFWGYKGEKFKNSKDISAILIQGDKGKQLFNMSLKYLDVEQVRFNDVADHNEQLICPSSIQKYDAEIMDIWKQEKSIGLEKRHLKEHWKAVLLYKFGII